MLRKWEIENMKKYFALVFLLAVCLTAVPGSVNAITLDENKVVTLQCNVGEEFTVDVPTGWSETSDPYIYGAVYLVNKDEYMSYDHYVMKCMFAGTRDLQFIVRHSNLVPVFLGGPIFSYKTLKLHLITKP